jgi:hypothetical protein
MAFLLTFNSILQVLAAFVIFLFGYLVLMALLLFSFFIVAGLYKGARMIQVYATRFSWPRSAVFYFSRGAAGDGD